MSEQDEKNPRQRRAKSNLVETATRRAFILRLRRSGATYEQVVQAAIKQFGIARLPKNYGVREAHRDVLRELERLRKEIREDATALREMMGGQLDELLLSVWPIATAPHNPTKAPDGTLIPPPSFDARTAAIDRVLKILDKKDKLFGVSMPKEKAPQQHQHLVLGLHAQLPQLPQFGEGSPLLQLSDDAMTMVMRLEKMLVGGNGHKELPGPKPDSVVVDGEYEEIHTDGEVE